MRSSYPRLGAFIEPDGVRFRVWAPAAREVSVVVEDARGAQLGLHPLGAAPASGHFEGLVPGLTAGARYRYELDGERRFPDPASRFQPEGVHGPSQVVDPSRFVWRDGAWSGLPLQAHVFYELHLGTFSPEGTFAGARRLLPGLRDLGVTAIELMPLADFPGRWNWGYDPAAFFAPARAYGQPDELRALIDDAHALGLAVFLDVVYNHLGPDGCYAAVYGPMLTDRHHTPWGRAVNLDDQGAEGVRAFFIDNACSWLEEYHFDGLRLDAVFAMTDDSPEHFLAELARAAEQVSGWKRYLIAEDYRNLAHLVRPRGERAGEGAEPGYGLDGQWADDFHHLLRRIVAGDCHGYYRDYPRSSQALAEAITAGWYFTGQHSEHLKRPRGTSPAGIPQERFVFCIQNHDQVGNRALGDRLHHTVDLATYRAASALLLFLPELPLLFMGQEWAASTPFRYFTDHNEELGRQVTAGRKEEFRDFPAMSGEIPDPQAAETFAASRLRWDEAAQMPHAGVLRLYRDLLARRQELEGAASAESPAEGALLVRRGSHLLLVALQPGLELELPAGAEICWQSEASVYDESPSPPVISGRAVRFPVPAALLLRLRSSARDFA